MSNATESYLALLEPHRAAHIWRYTPWRLAHPTGTTVDIPEATAPALSLTDITGGEAPDGVSLRSATAADIERLTGEHFGSGEAAAAFMRAIVSGDAAVLTVDANTTHPTPILLEIETRGKVCPLHLLIDIGALSQVEIVTTISGDAEWSGLLREGNVGDGAIYNDAVVQRMSGRLLRLDSIRHQRDAQVKFGTVAAAGTKVKADLRHKLIGRGAHLSIHGSILASDKQQQDHHIEIQHSTQDSFSRLDWHSACAGASTTTGTGMLRVDKGATGTDAAQVFHNLLLSKDAKANSIPELEVLESEVHGCGHGTANGPIDEAQKFYLEARGFSESEAVATLTEAFLNSTLSAMGSDEMRGLLIDLTSSYLNSI
jgi:Fe-S cluster assembly protein SufD